MVNAIFTIAASAASPPSNSGTALVQYLTGMISCGTRRALLRAPSYPPGTPARSSCQPRRFSGRGGIGRRATLRSLWAKARGSSSLLDRTKQSWITSPAGNPSQAELVSGAVRRDVACTVGVSAVRDRRNRRNIGAQIARRLWHQNPDCS